jgi:hypothetical protein
MKTASQGVLGCPDWPNHNVMTKGVFVMATRSLSQRQITQRLLKHRAAVATRAMQLARNAVKRRIQAEGLKVSQFSACEITLLAKAELERNHARLVAEAKHDIETWPGFEPWRLPSANITSDAQTQIEPLSMASAVQMSGAK